jgi:hypothetical protein
MMRSNGLATLMRRPAWSLTVCPSTIEKSAAYPAAALRAAKEKLRMTATVVFVFTVIANKP